MTLIHPPFRFLLLAAAAFSFWCLLSNTNHRALLKWRITDEVDSLLDDAADDALRLLQNNNSSNAQVLNMLGIREVQDSLACYVQQGSWIDQSFCPNTQCFLDDRTSSLTAALNLCSMLRIKKILLVGPETTFYLHTLWLHALSEHFNTSTKCTSSDFCTFHHICKSGALESSLRTPRNRKPPTLRELSTYGSSILRFVLSTTLYASSDTQDRFFTTPVIDPQTQVRIKNAMWINHAQHSDVIVMSRGPLAAPAWTYSFANNAISGNWSFVDDLYASPSTRYFTFDNETSLIPRAYYHRYQGAVRIINAALHVTLTVFLPGIMETLSAIQATPTKVLVWHGSWYLNPVCTKHHTPEGFSALPQLLSQFDDDDDSLTLDPWTLYHNAQVYMHDRLLPNILPHFGIVYLPLTIPLASPNVTYKGRKSDAKNMFGDEERKDCLRYPPREPEGRALEVAFLGGLVRLLEQML